MSWARGVDDQGREVGYAIKDTCHQTGCEERITRGVDHRCGGQSAAGPCEGACGDFFCSQHLFIVYGPEHPDGAMCLACITAWVKAHPKAEEPGD